MQSIKWGAAAVCAGAVLLFSGPANAVSIFASDCNFGFQDVYNAGDAVCVTGDFDIVPPGAICGEAYVVVTPTGSPNPFWDVSAGGANYVLGCGGAGAFYDEYVWLPPLVPGQYDLVVDQFPFFGGLGAEDLRVENAFTVSNAPIVFSVNVAAIKGAAMEGLEYAQSLHDLVLALTIIDTLSTAADWAGAFGTYGAGAAIALGAICYAADVPCPTSYNSAVISIGNEIIGGVADSLTLHYGAIILDPPDPDFDDVVPLVLSDAIDLGAPWSPGAGATLPTEQATVAQLLATQAAAYEALLPTIEKLQGAQNAGDHFGLLIQSEKSQTYAQLAIDAGDAMLESLDTMQATLEAAGTWDTTFDTASAFADVTPASLTDEDRNLIYSYGFSDADIDAGLTALGMLDVPRQASWQLVVESARGSFEAMRPALVDLIAQAEAVRQENEPLTLRLAPVASISAAAPAVVGDTVMLSATGTHADPDATLTYAWDLDGDGAFDDGTGPSVDFVPLAPGLAVASVEVSDGTRRDIALATISVAAGNAPPQFDAWDPLDYSPFAAPGDTVQLSVTATDPDGDPVTLAWTLDGEPAGSGASIEVDMPDEELHVARVVASDDDPYSADAALAFYVRAAKWQDGSVGEDDTSGGADGTAGDEDSGDGTGASMGSTEGGDATQGTGGTGDTDPGSADGGSGSGCGCRSADGGRPAPLLALIGLGLAFVRQRRRLD